MWTGRSSEAVFLPPLSHGSRQAHSEFRVRDATCARVRAWIDIRPAQPDRGPGGRWIIGGSLSLSGPSARLFFRSIGIGEGQGGVEPVVAERPLLPENASVRLEERMVHSRRVRAPYLWVSFVSARRRNLAGPIGAGRLGTDEITVEPVFEVPIVATTWLAARHAGRGGAALGLSGELVILHGIVMQLVMAPTDPHSAENGEAPDIETIEVVPPRFSIEFEPQTVVPGVNGRPFVSVALRDWRGDWAGEENTVGWLARL